MHPEEAVTALRLEQSKGVKLKRYQPEKGKKGDFIDENGMVYDGVSPAPAEFFEDQFLNWKERLADHIPKVNKAVVDLTDLGLTPLQKRQVIDHLNDLPYTDLSKVILYQ